MSVRYQNCIRPAVAGREMAQSIVDAGCVWLNARTKCYAQKVHAREVRIDQQGVFFEFELVTVRAEISQTHAVVRTRGRVADNQVRIRSESRAESLRGESEKKQKTAHPTTDNANVTDVEEEASSLLARASASGEHRLPGLFLAVCRNALNQVHRKNVVGKLPTTAG